MNNIIIRILCLYFILFINLAAQEPGWYKQKMDDEYPRSLYIIAKAESSTFKDAVNEAFSLIAAQVKVDIKAELESSRKSIDQNDASLFYESYNKKINTKVDITIDHIEVAKSEVVNNRHYVLVVLNKNKYLLNLEFKLNDSAFQITSLLDLSKKHINEGNIGLAVVQYRQVLKIFNENYYSDLLIYNSLSQIEFLPVDERISNKFLFNSIASFVNSLSIQTGYPNNTIEIDLVDDENKIIKVDVLFNSYGEFTPVPKFELRFFDHGNNLLKKTNTDLNGSAFIDFEQIPFAGENGKISVKFNNKLFGDDFSKYLNEKFIEIIYTVKNLSAADGFDVVISHNSKRFESLEKKIISMINETGNVFNRNSNYRFDGDIEISIQELEIEGKVYVARVNEFISLRKLPEGKILSKLKIKGKAIGNSSEEAKAKVLSHIKINKDDFLKSLSKALF